MEEEMEEEMEEATEEEMVGVMEEDVDNDCTIFEAVFVATENGECGQCLRHHQRRSRLLFSVMEIEEEGVDSSPP